jgi:hypothetical protein
MGPDAHDLAALGAADAVLARDLAAWLLAARAMGEAADGRLMLGGCPSLWTTAAPQTPKTHDLAFNISFVHEVCRQYAGPLLGLTRAVAASGLSVLWICHSRLDETQARGVSEKLGFGFDIVRPTDAAEVAAAYGACRRGLVTRYHAGVYCVASRVPFGFIGYDLKCWRLIDMLADEPPAYVLPIDRLAAMDLPGELARLLGRLEANAAPWTTAADQLLAHFDRETERWTGQLGL